MSNDRPSDDATAGLRRWADAVATPWRNGGGVTRELAGSPGDGDFDWRVSIADVAASGDFSLFPGVDRTIVQLEGGTMTLTLDGTAHPLVLLRPFDFDGGRAVQCAVERPTRDLNVMTRRDRCRAAVTVAHLDHDVPLPLPARRTQLVIALAGPVTVDADRDVVSLDRYDLFRAAPTAELVLSGAGPVAHVVIDDAANDHAP